MIYGNIAPDQHWFRLSGYGFLIHMNQRWLLIHEWTGDVLLHLHEINFTTRAQASLLYGKFENCIPLLLHVHLTGINELNVCKHLSAQLALWQWYHWEPCFVVVTWNDSNGHTTRSRPTKVNVLVCPCYDETLIVISAWIKKDKMQRCTWCFLPVCNLPPSQLSERDIKLCPMTPYGVGDFGQQWFRQWLVAWRHQAVTWTSVDLQLGRFCGITTLGQWVNCFIALLFFQGHPSNLFFKCHTGQKSPVLTRIGRFLTNSSLNWLMVTKWCTKLEIAENLCPILFHLNWAFPDWNCSFDLLMGLK